MTIKRYRFETFDSKRIVEENYCMYILVLNGRRFVVRTGYMSKIFVVYITRRAESVLRIGRDDVIADRIAGSGG